jgi:hypothetical protein
MQSGRAQVASHGCLEFHRTEGDHLGELCILLNKPWRLVAYERAQQACRAGCASVCMDGSAQLHGLPAWCSAARHCVPLCSRRHCVLQLGAVRRHAGMPSHPSLSPGVERASCSSFGAEPVMAATSHILRIPATAWSSCRRPLSDRGAEPKTPIPSCIGHGQT